MLVSSRNNLAPESQPWAGEVKRTLQEHTIAIQRMSSTLAQLGNQSSGLAQAVGQMNVKVLPIDVWGALGTSSVLTAETPIDTNYRYMILTAQYSCEETFAAGAAIRYTRVEGSWNWDVFPITTPSMATYTVQTSDTLIAPSITISGLFDTQANPGLYPTEPSVGFQTSTSGGFFTSYTAKPRITGSVIYVKEPS